MICSDKKPYTTDSYIYQYKKLSNKKHICKFKLNKDEYRHKHQIYNCGFGTMSRIIKSNEDNKICGVCNKELKINVRCIKCGKQEKYKNLEECTLCQKMFKDKELIKYCMYDFEKYCHEFCLRCFNRTIIKSSIKIYEINGELEQENKYKKNDKELRLNFLVNSICCESKDTSKEEKESKSAKNLKEDN